MEQCRREGRHSDRHYHLKRGLPLWEDSIAGTYVG